MSTPILPFATWASGTNQNSIPANDNSLRNEILNGNVLGTADDEDSGPSDGDIYIVGSSPTGAFATFDENDLAIYKSGTWYAYAPVTGIVVNVAGTLKTWDGSDYVDAATGGGSGAVDSVNGRTGAVTLTASDVYSTIVTDATTARSLDADDMGKYLRFTSASAKALTVQDNADEAITTGAEVHGRNAGAGDLTITEDTSVTVNAPAGGTLVIPEGGTFTLKKVATDEWDLFGVTVAA